MVESLYAQLAFAQGRREQESRCRPACTVPTSYEGTLGSGWSGEGVWSGVGAELEVCFCGDLDGWTVSLWAGEEEWRAGELMTVCRDGKAYVYGYVPIVVAKCGMMLKETGAPLLAVPGRLD